MKTAVVCLTLALALSTGTCLYQNSVIEEQSLEIEAQAQSYVAVFVYMLKTCHK
jgi:hypothetical protein